MYIRTLIPPALIDGRPVPVQMTMRFYYPGQS
jgi:hypothetical protein